MAAVNCETLTFSGHAVQRMFERHIRPNQVRAVIEAGEIIANYSDDSPLPSCLILGFVQDVPIHVVLAVDAARATCQVVTVYVPDPAVWHPDYRTRRT